MDMVDFASCVIALVGFDLLALTVYGSAYLVMDLVQFISP